MRHLLVINPNTSASVSALLQRHVQGASPLDVAVRSVTARFGAAYISDETSFAVASHATLDTWAAALTTPGPAPKAVLIGCFGDPGLLALRESCGLPVSGLAEAAMAQAARLGRFAIVTGGARWQPMLERLAHSLGYASALAGIHTLQATGAELAADPVAAHALLAAACQACVQHWGVSAVIVGGAGLAGMAAQLQAQVSVPLIDSVLAGAQEVWQASASAPRQQPGLDGAWQQLSPELMALATTRIASSAS